MTISWPHRRLCAKPSRPLLLLLIQGLMQATLAVLPACWTSALRTIPDTRSPYDALPSRALERLSLARDDLDQGRAESARSVLEALATEHPGNIAVGVRLQDAEIVLASEQRGAAAAAEDLRAVYRKRAEEEPTPANLVLAARLEPDPLAAAVLLERGAELDPRCAWCPYGLAWLAARDGDWARAREHLERAKAADPGHMPTLWLDTWMLARAGNLAEAITSFDTWIEKAVEDPRVDRHLLLSAKLDRALLAVQADDPELAKEILEELEGELDTGFDPARSHLIEAGAEQALGRPEAALEAARRAEQAGNGGLLPAVQQALLHEMWLGDVQAAEADWARALELSRSDPALGSLLERMRARVRLERAAAARVNGSAAPSADGAAGTR